ncbi:DUF4041 domain-containing protein [Tenacibaculum ovolyticum]|uniref:DUF4041 domain-containing protein n=1 Tax=Tenacibaculum ovolyticum TaxID=104270 RepID=UPI0003F8C1C4|nr:DUF4041 domain-containing protein [Tenacibaculum ovolyticum]
MWIIIILLLIVILVQIGNIKSVKEELAKEKKRALANNEKLKEELYEEQEKYRQYYTTTEYLKKYEIIKDIEIEHSRIRNSIKQDKERAFLDKQEILKEARSAAKDIKNKAEVLLNNTHLIVSEMEATAEKRAIEVAGEAWEVKQNATHYEATLKAMKNRVKGYGDEYLVPNESLLDELAEEYNHTVAGRDLNNVRVLIKSMIKNHEVADCDYVIEERKRTAIEFVIDAFNGKVDSIMSKVKHDNYGVLEQKLKDAYRLVNHNGKAFKNARIAKRYYDVILEQLKLSVIVQELKNKDREEQKVIREAIREEEKARREYEKAVKDAEKEERLLAKALKEAEMKFKSAALEEKEKYEEELNKLKEDLIIAKEKGNRALSMAQQTKQGHVYVISNIGSFGENIFKIGLTRRLNPLDRVKELGDASVPFSFDVHAMIHSEDAPKLEKELHSVFKNNQVNKVNSRKEFFNLQLTDIKNEVASMNLNPHWTMKAEAQEYRESKIMNQEVLQSL